MPGLVEVFVKGARCRPGLPRWDHGCLAGLGQRFEHPLVGIEGFVGNERLGLKFREQRIGSSQVMGGFKWSSQHFDGGGCDEGWEPALGSGATSRVAGVAWPTRRGAA